MFLSPCMRISNVYAFDSFLTNFCETFMHIIISLQQSPAGHRPPQFYAIQLDFRHFSSSYYQPYWEDRRSTSPEGVHTAYKYEI